MIVDVREAKTHFTRLLPDTHALLWWRTDDDRLSNKARQVIADEANEIVAALALVTRDPAFAGFGSKTLW